MDIANLQATNTVLPVLLTSTDFHPTAVQHATALLNALRDAALPTAVTLAADRGVCLQWPAERMCLLCWEDVLLLETPVVSLECAAEPSAPDYAHLLDLCRQCLVKS